MNGDGATALPTGAHAVDSFDSYSYNAFLAGKYRGFNFIAELYARELNDFAPALGGVILYQDSAGETALFPANQGLFDYGMTTQVGYFVVPRKLPGPNGKSGRSAWPNWSGRLPR